jgi:hypothetical protein
MTVKKIARTTAHQLFSTKSFVPGHVIGTAALLFGTIALTRYVIKKHEAEVTTALPALPRGQYRRASL